MLFSATMPFRGLNYERLSDSILTLLARSPLARWSAIPLRLIVGYGFMQHGFAKLSRGPDAFAAILQGMGVPEPHLMAWLTVTTELLGGFAVLLGAFVAIVSVPMTAVLLDTRKLQKAKFHAPIVKIPSTPDPSAMNTLAAIH